MNMIDILGERVSFINRPKSNIMVVAPHGFDDNYTVEICFAIQKEIDCNLVTNNGFKRSDNVDTINDFANCNNTKHCNNPVVHQEFTKPIIKFAKNHKNPIIFFIHGLGINIKKDFVLGYGLGISTNENRSTMSNDTAEIFYNSLTSMGYNVAFGKGGGKYAGYSKTNLNQIFNNKSINAKSLQIEISANLRLNDLQITKTSKSISKAIISMLLNTSNSLPYYAYEFI